MTPQIILNFLLPQSADLLQWVFLTVIFLMLTATIVSTHRSAQVSSWEKNWNRNGGNYAASDSLGIEHGSVTDLWHAVATPPEKLSEAMPGMLLVVGLLGTFIGLGVALNHASEILGQSNALAASNAANSMQDLLGLLQGLGTKFKTSTWGILGFIILKIWSETTRFDDKRLSWVIQKFKVELEKRSEIKELKEARNAQLLFNQMGSASNLLINAITTQSLLQINAEKIHHEQSLAAAFDIRNAIITMHTALPEAINQSTSRLDQRLNEIHGETKSTGEAMRGFIQNSESVMTGMLEGSKDIVKAADQMSEAIEEFEDKFTVVLDNIRTTLEKSVVEMGERASKQLSESSALMQEASKNIASELERTSGKLGETMNGINESVKKASDSQEKSTISLIQKSETSCKSLLETTNEIKSLTTAITKGLSAVSDSRQQMNTVGRDINDSIKLLRNFSEWLKELPSTLAPLKNLNENHLELINRLSIFAEMPERHIELFEELKSLHADVRSAAKILAAPASTAP
jgi:ABC-type transporter Mla subunit MlaD